MWQWFKSFMHDEFETFIGLFIVAGVLFVGGFFGDFFGKIGDKLFGKEPNDPS